MRGKSWYKLNWYVCQKWRNLIFTSSFHQGISLVCTLGTPITDMLTHSSPLPPIIDHVCGDFDVIIDAKEKMLVDRQDELSCSRNSYLRVETVETVETIAALLECKEQFPILEYFIIMIPNVDESTILVCFSWSHISHTQFSLFSAFISTSSIVLIILSSCYEPRRRA